MSLTHFKFIITYWPRKQGLLDVLSWRLYLAPKEKEVAYNQQ